MTYKRKTFNEIKYVIKARIKGNPGQPWSNLKEFRYEKTARNYIVKLSEENPEYEIAMEQFSNVV